jgi:cytochrome c oxidase assembly factor CtaG
MVVTLASLGSLADELFWVHMVEHLAVGDIGTLLLVLGLTAPVLAPVLRIGFFDRLRILAHPLVAFPLWAVDLYLWHVPVVHEAALRHDALHALQHACFVLLGANMWMALIGPLPKPAWFGNLAKLIYVIAVRLTGALLGNILVFGGNVFYPIYAAGERAHGITAAGDQNAAGAVMMVEGSIVTLFLFGWLFARAAREGEERQELLDLATARGVALTEERAARAVAAGRGADLRRRIEAAAPPARKEVAP